MSELNEKCLDIFPVWLRSLGEDIEIVLHVVEVEGVDPAAKRQLVAGINYLFKSLDLIPDGIDDIGYLDDAFVLRVSTKLVLDEVKDKVDNDHRAALESLAKQTGLIEEFLGSELYGRLVTYVEGLKSGSARGRSVEEIVTNAEVGREFASEARTFSKGYESPSFSREEKNLIKLRAFFDAKLPR